MKKSRMIIFAIAICFIINPSNIFSQWQMYPSGYPNAICEEIKFLNENTGYMTGGFDGLFLKSTNGGANWSGQQISGSGQTFIGFTAGLYFFDENTGYVCGGSNFVYKTTDGAQTWTAQPVPFSGVSMIYNDIFFVNENTGYICGRSGYISKTTDAGENWNLIYESQISDVVSIWFANPDTGIAGDQFGGIYKTTNGGTDWSYQQLMDKDSIIYANNRIQFVNQNTGFIASRNTPYNMGIVWKTTNQGVNWFPILREFNVWLENLYFFTPDKGFAIGRGGKCLYTSNSGESWQTIQVGTISEGYYGLDFINESTGFISTFAGNIYKTTTGGTVSIGNEVNLIPDKFQISKAYPNPFNPTTNITIELTQESLNTGELNLEIFDIRGAIVNREKIIPDGSLRITKQINLTGNQSGIYFARVSGGSLKSNTIKLVLLK